MMNITRLSLIFWRTFGTVRMSFFDPCAEHHSQQLITLMEASSLRYNPFRKMNFTALKVTWFRWYFGVPGKICRNDWWLVGFFVRVLMISFDWGLGDAIGLGETYPSPLLYRHQRDCHRAWSSWLLFKRTQWSSWVLPAFLERWSPLSLFGW